MTVERTWMQELRNAKGMSINEMARRADVCAGLLRGLEDGAFARTTNCCACDIAEAYGMTPEQQASIGGAGRSAQKKAKKKKAAYSPYARMVLANAGAICAMARRGGETLKAQSGYLGIAPSSLRRMLNSPGPVYVTLPLLSRIAQATGRPVEELTEKGAS